MSDRFVCIPVPVGVHIVPARPRWQDQFQPNEHDLEPLPPAGQRYIQSGAVALPCDQCGEHGLSIGTLNSRGTFRRYCRECFSDRCLAAPPVEDRKPWLSEK